MTVDNAQHMTTANNTQQWMMHDSGRYMMADDARWRMKHDSGQRMMADDAWPWRTIRNHGGWCMTMVDDTRPWQVMHDHGGQHTTMADDTRSWQMMLDCVSVDTQLCDYQPSCRIQNDYFKIKYTLLMGMSVCCWLSDSMVGCRVLIVNCGLSDLTVDKSSWQSGHRWSDSPTVSWVVGQLSDSQTVDCWTVGQSTVRQSTVR